MIAEQTPALGTLPLVAAVTFLGFLDTHPLLPVLALTAVIMVLALAVTLVVSARRA